MTVPTVLLRVDWENAGTFVANPIIDTVVPLDINVSRGKSAPLTAEAMGSMDFELDNADDAYTPDRNWADASFQVDVSAWSTLAIASLTAAATSITQVTDTTTGGATKAAEAVLTGTINSGVTRLLPYRFRSGVTYSFSFYAKSMSGTLNCRLGLASSGTPADIGTTSTNITTSWALYTGTWTPSSDRTDAVILLRTNTGSAATVRIGAVQVNPGSTANTYLEAPTKGQLVPGRPVHLQDTFSATTRAKFYGFIERIKPIPALGQRKVKVTCYDVLRRLSKTDVVMPDIGIQRTPRDCRIAVLEDFERGDLNLIPNPTFATDTSNWTASAGATLTRTATGGPTGIAATYATLVTTNNTTQNALNYARLVPRVLSGEVYRGSVYLQTTSGTSDWVISLTAGGTTLGTATWTATTTWTRFTVTAAMDADYTAASATPLALVVTASDGAGGTIRISATAVTRGKGYYPWSATGSGRYPNFVATGGFDGGSTGWYNGFANLIGNPSFETNTTGWSVAGDAFTGAATSITRNASNPVYGSASATVAPSSNNQGAFYAVTGTFKSGKSYAWGISVRKETAGSDLVTVSVGSQGTPANVSTANNGGAGITSTYVLFSGTFTATADRTDVHMSVKNNGANNFIIDGAYIFRLDTGSPGTPIYSDTGPGGGGSFIDTKLPTSDVAKYGYKGYKLTTVATATAGVVYDFNDIGAYFISGVQYVMSAWIYPESSCPYKIGIGANKGDGTWDEASATGTASANAWTQVTFTWTPAASYAADAAFDVVAYAYQTDANAHVIHLDGVRVIPGSAADNFEMTQWSLATGGESTDNYLSTATLSGNALSCLTTLNSYTLTRHWITATTASPWYQYVTQDRTTFQTQPTAETITETLEGFDELDIDAASITNIVGVTWNTGTDYYGDATSTGAASGGAGYGPNPTSTISAPTFFSGRTIPDKIGPAYVARYKDPLARPILRLRNLFPTQLARDLNDVIVVTVGMFRIRSARYVILREDLHISMAAFQWDTDYQLEEFPYPGS